MITLNGPSKGNGMDLLITNEISAWCRNLFFSSVNCPSRVTQTQMLKFVPAEGHLKRKAHIMMDKVKSMHITESIFPFFTTIIFKR